jgi:hypothetical protein
LASTVDLDVTGLETGTNRGGLRTRVLDLASLLEDGNEFAEQLRNAATNRKLDEISLGLGFVMDELVDEIRAQRPILVGPPPTPNTGAELFAGLLRYRGTTLREPLGTTHLVTRDRDRHRVTDSLHSHGRVVVTGLSGLGKTSLIKRWLNGNLERFTDVIWLDVGKLEQLEEQCVWAQQRRSTPRSRQSRVLLPARRVP